MTKRKNEYKDKLSKIIFSDDAANLVLEWAKLLKKYYNAEVEFYIDQKNRLKENIISGLAKSSSGSYIGEGFHGGASREWWATQYDLYEEAKEMMNDI